MIFERFWQEVALCFALQYADAQLPAWCDLRKLLAAGEMLA